MSAIALSTNLSPANPQPPASVQQPENAQEDRFAQLRKVRAGLRSDLMITRQVYQGQAVYVLHDPVTFQTHRLSLDDYLVASQLRSGAPLETLRQSMVAKGIVADDESDFYQFIIQLHQLNLLALPLHRSDQISERRQKILQSQRRGWAQSVLCLKIPLSNPDQFLTTTAPLLSWLFKRWFALVWMVTAIITLVILSTQAKELIQPFNGMLAGRSLVIGWFILIGLKVWHELGHGYACKVFGGRVPEMGAMLFMGTPAAYVDATAAWSFEHKRHRIVTMLGGMYFESLVAMPAVFIWAFSEEGLLKSCAYQVFFMASAVTVLFNANPLMKYDGYFILSELVGVQNLRAKGAAELTSLSKRWFLGIRPTTPGPFCSYRIWMLVYGFLSGIYSKLILVGIGAGLASQFGVPGMAFAMFIIGRTVWDLVTKAANYLLRSDEAKATGWRAKLVAGIFAVGLPCAAWLLPMSIGVVVRGVMGAEHEHYLRVKSPGEVAEVAVLSGTDVGADALLVRLGNAELESQLEIAKRELSATEMRWRWQQSHEPYEAAKTKQTLATAWEQYDQLAKKVEWLTMRAPFSGRLVSVVERSAQGAFKSTGEELGMLVSGARVVRAYVTTEELYRIAPQVVQTAECRVFGSTDETLNGVVVAVRPAARQELSDVGITQLAGGDVIVHPETLAPVESVYEIHLRLTDSASKEVPIGARVAVRFGGKCESLASWMVRGFREFLGNLLTHK